MIGITPIAGFVARHSVGILTGLAVAGVGATAVESARAHVKAQEIRYQRGDTRREDLVNLVKARWKCYIRPVACGAFTIGCIIAANRISASRLAAASLALGAAKTELGDIRKAVESLPEETRKEVQEKIQERRTERIVRESPVVQDRPNVEILWYESFTGRYFRATRTFVENAVNECNHEITHGDSVSLNEFLGKMALTPTDAGELLGWGILGPLIEIDITAGFDHEGKPCAVLGFVDPPKPSWHKIG
jgi:hypothetical protein|nr:MAG TPA: hypothetical protein [Caudoviricetes sp.]